MPCKYAGYGRPMPGTVWRPPATLVCADCGELVVGDESTTWQQWQCDCCGSWHDKENRASPPVTPPTG